MSAVSIDTKRVLAAENVHHPEGAGSGVSKLLIGVGVVLIGLTVIGAVTGDAAVARVALAAYHVGFLLVCGVSLISMAFVMMLHQTNGGWGATIRRQFENIAGLIWLGALLFLGGIVLQLLVMGKGETGTYLFSWMNEHYTAGDVIYQGKRSYLNVPWFYIRAAVYFGLWIMLAMGLCGYSLRQDEDGDRWHTARARKLSAVGLLIFAFTTAFASFDWVMSLDFHWFSTMFGVWFFAGNMVSALATGTLVLLLLRYFGRLHVAFTDEHLHDLGKLIFGFTVFWAYISFSQYFLIWYANIPEETAWFMRRQEGMWGVMSWLLPIGHFIVPFVWLMARPARRKPLIVGIGCIWLLGMHIMDVFWFVRPEAGKAAGQISWLDVVGIAGPLCLFAGLLITRVSRHALIPLKDPRLGEALHHKNYV